ncbi:hypothetical protein Y032_0076g1017 [Ancylostoma ceylanicum]|uniref:Uncharacterized protein n=1 Tax=Ancylostoma ceylanicum TaxID=53326 RepID=A0A016TUN8_9BILA|nr:hypothetical protein Y032_0076g1017 [Ancylostoma ceylanicum]
MFDRMEIRGSLEFFKYYIQCIRNDESAQAVNVTAGSLVDIIKTTMKRETQIRDDDVECWQAWVPLDLRPRGRTRRFGWTVCSRCTRWCIS